MYPAECGEQLGTDPSKIGSSKSLVLKSFSGEGTLWDSSLPVSLTLWDTPALFTPPLPLPQLFSRRFREGISFPSFVEKSIPELPLSKLCAVPVPLQNRALFEGERRRKNCREKGRPAKGAKRKKGRVKTGQKPYLEHSKPYSIWTWTRYVSFSFSVIAGTTSQKEASAEIRGEFALQNFQMNLVGNLLDFLGPFS